MALTKEQTLAIKKLSKLRAGALFMEMGTGKTRTMIELTKLRTDYDVIAWIAPAALIKDAGYVAEINKWQPTKPIVFFTAEGVGSSNVKFLELSELADKKKVWCVIDESICFKNLDAKRVKRLLSIWHKFAYRFILNGTPLTKSLLDLLPQINFLHPKILNMTESQFANNFLIYKKEGARGWRQWSKPANEAALVEMIRPYIFDAKLDLDVEQHHKVITTNLSLTEADRYASVKGEFLAKYDNEDDIDFFSMMQTFQHFYTQNEDKDEKLQEVLQEIKARGEKCIIYVKFLSEVDKLKKKLENFVVMTGKEKGDVGDFKDDADILICTYGVGSFGLNLQFANNIIFLSQTFDYKMKKQAEYRIYRMGQERRCNYYDFYVNVGLEELIQKSLEKKENTLNNVKNYIKKKKKDEIIKAL
jgi:SNF2 family DNA or RNA helicase